tara:strand:+ start:1487 stop:2278 length:792 start_codon:yes stop_codon:yes gene_type:complete
MESQMDNEQPQTAVNMNEPIDPIQDKNISCNDIDMKQLEILEILYNIFDQSSIDLNNNFEEFFTNYYKEGNKKKQKNKGGPLDNWFERYLRGIIQINSSKLKLTNKIYNDFAVPDIIHIMDDYILCIDGKTNCGDGDKHKEKIHLGINQSNLGSINIEKYVSPVNPHEKWGNFRGDIKAFYNDLPTLTFIIKLVYQHKEGNIGKCDELHIYLIPHRDTFNTYKDSIKRGANKAKDEQRLDISDDRLVKVIKLSKTSSPSANKI